MNKAILIGNLTRDPETKTTQSGVSCCTFTVAVTRRFANASGTREADFIPVVCWRQLADLCVKYLAKGRKVCVEGSIQTRSYDAQDGSKRYVTEIVADNVEFLTSKADEGARPSGYEPPESPAPRRSNPVPDTGDGFGSSSGKDGGFTDVPEDDLPF